MADKLNESYAHVCRGCGQPTDGIRIDLREGPHVAKLVCSFCGGFLKWVPKDADAKPDARKRNANLVAKFSPGYCELCFASADNLGDGQTLEAHHKREVKLHGGTDDRTNIWIVCSSCHALIHHQRRYRANLYSEVKCNV